MRADRPLTEAPRCWQLRTVALHHHVAAWQAAEVVWRKTPSEMGQAFARQSAMGWLRRSGPAMPEGTRLMPTTPSARCYLAEKQQWRHFPPRYLYLLRAVQRLFQELPFSSSIDRSLDSFEMDAP